MNCILLHLGAQECPSYTAYVSAPESSSVMEPSLACVCAVWFELSSVTEPSLSGVGLGLLEYSAPSWAAASRARLARASRNSFRVSCFAFRDSSVLPFPAVAGGNISLNACDYTRRRLGYLTWTYPFHQFRRSSLLSLASSSSGTSK